MKKVCTDMNEHKRKVGDRGQVTIPKEIRDRRGIEGGDEIEFVEANDEIVIKPPTDKERLAEGYRERAERSRQLAEEMAPASSEAADRLGEAPDWSE
jgi:AbrB family looped-hinge helix DNA binding protein